MRTGLVPPAILLPLAALSLVSCGGDGGGGGDVEAFCERLREAEAADDTSADPEEDFDASMAQIEEIRELAPSDVRDDLDVMIEKLREVEALEAEAESEEDAFGAVFAALFDPEFIAASERLEAFGVDECGLEPSETGGFELSTDDDLDDGDSDTESGADGTAGGLITEAADVPDPLFDPMFDDDGFDPDELSLDGLQYFLDVEYTDAPWRTELTAFGVGTGGATVGGIGLDDVAVEVCAAVAEYLVRFEPDAPITIEAYVQSDDGSIGYDGDLVSGNATDGC